MVGETKSKTKAKETAEASWTVFCENAVPTRDNPSGFQEHGTADGTVYKLHHKLPCEMPARHATTYLRDPAFIVLDAEGERVFPMVAPATAGQGLLPGQVIATLAELSDQAILNRARQVNSLAEKKLGRAALMKIIETGVASPPKEEAVEDEDPAAEAELTDE